ncbi:RNA exonuclease ngl2 [Coemansia javaensis]|uniref:RNA exonuclease ngl2 n=1 Tax=Coemansia javaensis TaxID=2761396 RepID=A0A9W8LGE5_9FUNG|nr:RNA exonuclease ngl2 [Coemansia javaensis]
MSYNLLCQKMIKRQLFPYASKSSLKWRARRPLILGELSHLRPDVMCLQEVDTKNWDDTYSMWFAREGYDAQSFQGAGKPHCLAVSWRRDRFAQVDRLCVQMDRSAEACGERLRTDNVALVVALRATGGPLGAGVPGIILSNTHLYWLPGACYERLQQQVVLARALRTMRERHPDFPLIACGDYNTTPDDGAYALLTRPRPVSLNDWQLDNLLPRYFDDVEDGSDHDDDDDDDDDKGGPSDDVAATTTGERKMAYAEMAAAGTAAETEAARSKRRRLAEEERRAEEQLQRDTARVSRLVAALQSECREPLASCYGNYAALDPAYATPQWEGEPVYTNYAAWKGTLDYIFFSPGRGIAVRDVLSLPPESQLKPGLPNETFSSDHVALVARFDAPVVD